MNLLGWIGRVLTKAIVGIKGNFKFILYSILVVSIVLNVQLTKKNRYLDQQIGVQMSNTLHYENLLNNQLNHNNVLKLNVRQLAASNDSLLKRISKVQQSNKIKDKQIKDAAHINFVIRDTITIEIQDSTINLPETELRFNDQTIAKVKIENSELQQSIDIQSDIDIIRYHRKVYRNQYKNGWVRFWHFDWKKDQVSRYVVDFSNDKIKINDIRVIEIQQ